MKPLEISRLSDRYRVKKMGEADVPEIYALTRTNPQYGEFCGAEMTPESITDDLTLLPPGVGMEDKYNLGLYDGGRLIAVLDFIAGYPDEKTVFVGFFMVDGSLSCKGVGSGIIGELCASLKAEGFSAVRLGYDKHNPQASRFWVKNRFEKIQEVSHQYAGELIVAERCL